MNVLVSVLASDTLGKSFLESEGLRIEDNVGESIHIHYRNLRFDLTIEGFLTLAENVEQSLASLEEIQHGDH